MRINLLIIVQKPSKLWFNICTIKIVKIPFFMKNKKFLRSTWIFFLVFTGSVFAQNQGIPEQIPLAIRTGDAKMLAAHFNEVIELVILSKEDMYSKEQAEKIIRDFFTKNQPTQFTIKHQGGKSKSRYAIGQLTTRSGNYRVYFLLKGNDNKALIHQLRFEPSHE